MEDLDKHVARFSVYNPCTDTFKSRFNPYCGLHQRIISHGVIKGLENPKSLFI